MKKTIFSLPIPTLLIIAAACLWAVDGIIRRSLFALLPLVIVFYEHLIGSILLLPLAMKQLLQEKLDRKSLILILIVSVWSGLLGTLWFTTALSKVQFIPFSVVFLLQKLQPIFASTAAVLVLKEKIQRNYLVWASLAFGAAYFVTFPTGLVNLQTGAGTIEAALYALGAAFCWGTATVFSKLLLKKHTVIVVTALRFVVTALCAAIVLLALGFFDATLSVTSSQLLRFVTIALSTGMVALYLYYKGLAHTEAKIATILELSFPFLAVLIDGFMYKSFLSWSQLLASGTLIFAIYKTGLLTQKNKQLHPLSSRSSV